MSHLLSSYGKMEPDRGYDCREIIVRGVALFGDLMQTTTAVGTCGFAVSHAKTYHDFGIVEVQQTFYQPPRVTTVRRWREQAPRDFIFTLKAWQLLTHEAGSPTYRRLREPLSGRRLAQAGSFKWNPVTRTAWQRTRELAAALQAEAVVFQTPRSFVPTPDNLRRLYRFFEIIDRQGRRMVFEPRGDAWTDEIVRRVITDLNLVHGVDPFLRRPVGRGLRYFRLHGRPAYHYHYRYANADLSALQELLSRAWPNRALFNNDNMTVDANRFIRMLNNVA
jgi:uncharacterized protein YecE (DUF72 family)